MKSMKVRKYRVITLLLLLGLSLVGLVMIGLWAGKHALAAPADVTFTVDTQVDLIDPDTTDGVCPAGSCSLRAAIMQANVMTVPAVTIIVPHGTYTLTRPRAGLNGPDNGDLNLTTPIAGSDTLISIVGAGPDSTFVDATSLGDRVLVVQTGRQASISGLTIQHGLLSSPGSGGGIQCGHADPHAGCLEEESGTVWRWYHQLFRHSDGHPVYHWRL